MEKKMKEIEWYNWWYLNLQKKTEIDLTTVPVFFMSS